MTVTTEDGGRQNVYATEPRMYQSTVEEAQDNAEKTNGRLVSWQPLLATLSQGRSFLVFGEFTLPTFYHNINNLYLATF